MTRERSSGFTLVEVLIVVAIIAILATIAIGATVSALDKAKQRATMADIRIVGRTIEAYTVDNNFPPDDAGGLLALVPVLVPYQSEVLPVRDHWRKPLAYAVDTQGNYTIESYGRDGVPGADITRDTRFDYDLDIVMSNGFFVAAPE